MTEQEAIAILSAELAGSDGFLARLQRGEGIDEDAVRRVNAAFQELRQRWEGREQIPKAAVLAMTYVDDMIYPYVHLYPGRESELRALEHELMRHVYRCLGRRVS